MDYTFETASGLNALPNELLHNVLTPLSTSSLLPVTRVSHRFCDLALRILRQRLAVAASLGDRTLFLECYHPSAKQSADSILCSYLGTKGLDDASSANILHDGSAPPGRILHQYNNLYSRFRPHPLDEVKTGSRWRHPAGDIPGSRTYFGDPAPGSDQTSQEQSSSSIATSSSTAHGSSAAKKPGSDHTSQKQSSSSNATSFFTTHASSRARTHGTSADDASENIVVSKPVKQLVHLDSGELFSQLQATTTLNKIGPKGLIFSTVEVSDGVIRVFRDWLRDMSKSKAQGDVEQESYNAQYLGLAQDSWDEGQGLEERASSLHSRGKGKARSPVDEQSTDKDDEHPAVLWVNDGRNVGVRFSVQECKWRKDKPILYQHEEELAASFEIQFEEVLVRTRHLLMATERSLLEQQSISGKAVIFGVWG